MLKWCLASFLLFYAITDVNGASMRLIGGFEANFTFGKYQASLQNLSGYHVCGGAVVSEQHVVTAAHCLYGTDPKYIKLVVGTADLRSVDKQYNVESFSIYEEFNFTNRTNDIAIIKSTEPFDLNKVEIIKLYPKELQQGDPVTLTGFGAKEMETDWSSETCKVSLSRNRLLQIEELAKPNGKSSKSLHEINLEVFSQNTCKYAMRYTREVVDTMFCTFTAIGQGTCHGDSGSPVVIENQLAGLVSWGIPCGVGFPDVHTRITKYIPWILRQINSI